MWTFSVRNSSLDQGQVRVVVDFTNGKETFDRIYFPTSVEDLQQQIKNQLDTCSRNDQLIIDLDQLIIASPTISLVTLPIITPPILDTPV